jgi:gluconolactonase
MLHLTLLLLALQDDLVAADAKLEKAATGFTFTEGPASDPDGNCWFSDVRAEKIHKFDLASGKATLVREKTGRANGLMCDAKGVLYACEGGNGRVVKIDGEKTTPVADKFNDKPFNSPNDLCLDAKGGLYFTDPSFRGGKASQDKEAVYHVNADGKVARVADDLARPNGLILSLDGKILYVADTAGQKVRAYDVKEDGSLAGGRDFAKLDDSKRGGPDGMTIDEKGNVYAAGQGNIWIWDSAGKLLKKIEIPEGPTNCTFAGKERRTLFVTAQTSLYRIEMKVKGGR